MVTEFGHEHASHTWDDDQEWERNWWGDCTHTFAEELKHIAYSKQMGLDIIVGRGQWPVWDLAGKNVLDIGGGPVSMLLKAYNRGPYCTVADPCAYPQWVHDRYKIADIHYLPIAGEDLTLSLVGKKYDEVWIYNVLQHTQDPELIIANAWEFAPVIRLFEWVDIPPHQGHPHELKKVLLDYWLHGDGQVQWHNNENNDGMTGNGYGGRFERP
jgi:hypothetical protein